MKALLQHWRMNAFLFAATTCLLLTAAEKPTTPPVDHRPLQLREGTILSDRGYMTSDACQSCHANQYETWHASYHRTMSQVVSTATVIADFDNIELAAPKNRGERYRLDQNAEGYWVELPSTVAPGSASQRRRRIVQSTGSHHYQLYWYPSGAGRELNMLPFVFLRDEKRWVPRDAVFLQPPDWSTDKIVWNYQCLPCHTTDGQPGYSPTEPVTPGGKSPDTKIAEMGIGCEMCHGPGEKHVSLARAESSSANVSAAIVHPKKIAAPRSAQICGQCHSVNVPYRTEDWVDYLLDGPTFRAGDDLRRSRYVVDPKTVAESPLMNGWLAGRQRNLDDWFWSDGMVRVTGREYNGLMRSPCFGGGEFSCLSCHSPHASEPDDQLKPAMRGDDACLQCHQSLRERVAAHTHHRSESSGSRCYNCHMPHTTYGLLKASRSHTVDSPTVATTIATGRPNACNLCHLDRTLAWTARNLHEWYGQPDARIVGDNAEFAASILGLLEGDAGQRAIYSWHMGWPEARAASGEDWLAPFLTHTLDDPYDVVRYIGARSLRALPGYESFPYDFVAPKKQRTKGAAEALRLWDKRPAGDSSHAEARPHVLIGEDGAFDLKTAGKILKRRNDRPMLLGE